MNSNLSGNIWKMTFILVTNKRPYMTFLTIFLLTMPNATAQTIGLLTFASQIAGFFLEIPSGYLADKLGHKKALVLSRVALTLSTACYLFANSIIWFFAGSILLAAGWAFASGTVGAFMHDTLSAMNQENRYAEIFGRMKSIGFAIPIILILLLPILAEESFRTAFAVMLAVDIVGIVAAVLLVNPDVKEQKIDEIDARNLLQTFQDFLKMDWAKYVLLTAIGGGIVFGIAAGFKDPYQQLLGFSLTMLGVLWATSRVFITLLLLINGRIHKLLSYKQFVLIKLFLYSLCYMGIGLVSNMWIVATLFIVSMVISYGLGAAASHYDLEYIGKNNNRKATLLSISAFLKNIFGGLTALGMGAMVVAQSYPLAYLLAGICLFLLTIVSFLTLNSRGTAKI